MNNPYSAPSAQIEEFDQGEETYTPTIFALEGRIGRLRYIGYSWITLFIAVFAMGVLTAVFSRSSGSVVFQFLSSLPILAVSIIMARRRLHDLNHSGWWAVLTIIPLANLGLGLYLLCAPGTEGPNNYGPPPDKSSSIWVVLLILPIVIIGILAAIAIPAYHDYTVRAKAAREQQLQQQPQQPQQDQQSQQNQQ